MKLPNAARYCTLPDGSRYCTGTSMCRTSYGTADTPQRMNLQRVHLDAGGYDNGGAYWGIGKPLYRAWSDDVEFYTRANDRTEARAITLQRHPFAKIRR